MQNLVLKSLKLDIVRAAYKASEGHIASAFSILDLLWVLYDRIMSIDPADLDNVNSDRFILSKGHASLALYAVLARKGFFSPNELNYFCKYNSMLGGHPDCNKIPGVEASTGSLGHGFPIAVGVALGSRIQGIDNRIYCLLGDGECNEGTIWESALLAAHHKLSNLCCIVDFNHSTDRAVNMGDIAAKFRSFGWRAEVIPGHDHEAIYSALNNFSGVRPVAIIAETIKGYGVKCMEGQPAWHHRSPNDVELEMIIKELS